MSIRIYRTCRPFVAYVNPPWDDTDCGAHTNLPRNSIIVGFGIKQDGEKMFLHHGRFVWLAVADHCGSDLQEME